MDLEFNIENIRCHKTIVLPIIIGALGAIKNGTNQLLNKIPGSSCSKHEYFVELFIYSGKYDQI